MTTSIGREECRRRHGALKKWIFGSIGLVTMIVSAVLWCSGRAMVKSDDAIDRAGEVSRDFASHERAQVETLRRIEETMVLNHKWIKESVTEIKRDVRILRNGKE